MRSWTTEDMVEVVIMQQVGSRRSADRNNKKQRPGRIRGLAFFLLGQQSRAPGFFLELAWVCQIDRSNDPFRSNHCQVGRDQSKEGIPVRKTAHCPLIHSVSRGHRFTFSKYVRVAPCVVRERIHNTIIWVCETGKHKVARYNENDDIDDIDDITGDGTGRGMECVVKSGCQTAI